MLNYLNLFKKFFTKKWYFSCEKNIDLILLDNNFAKLKFKNLKYFGFDATKYYIKHAKKYFKKNKNTYFEEQDLYSLSKKHYGKYDITYNCNVLLHLPTIETPLSNLIKSTKKYCIIRTLISKNTHLSQALFTDRMDKNGNPKHFCYHNTYSYDKIIKTVNKLGKFKIKFIKDTFNETKINKDFLSYKNEDGYKNRDGLTRSHKNVQICGSKVYEWEWVKITRI